MTSGFSTQSAPRLLPLFALRGPHLSGSHGLWGHWSCRRLSPYPTPGLGVPIPACCCAYNRKGCGDGGIVPCPPQTQNCWGEIGSCLGEACRLFGHARGPEADCSAAQAPLLPTPFSWISYFTFPSMVLTGLRAGSPCCLGRWPKV